MRIAPFYLNSELEQIDGIDTIIPAKMITHGCSIDGYANGLLSPDNRSQFIIFLTNITAYKQMVKQSLIKTEITAPADTSLLQILESMEFGGKIIIQTGLNNFLGKTVGDKVNVSFGSCLEMEIAGVCEMLPGITPMFWSAPKNGYRYIILGSLYDFQKVVLEGYGDTDLILQRRFYNPGNPNPDLGAMNWWGNINEWYYSSSIDPVLSTISGINKTTNRISAPASWHQPELKYYSSRQNFTYESDVFEPTADGWKYREHKIYTIDPITDKGFGNMMLKETTEDAKVNNISTVDDLLRYYDEHHPEINATIVYDKVIQWGEANAMFTQYINPLYW